MPSGNRAAFVIERLKTMPYIPPDLITQARQLDLLTYLRTCDPDELVHVAGNEFCTKTHDSLRISNGCWAWNSQGIAGRSALDYLIKVRGMGFLDATETILREIPSIQAGGSVEPPASSLPRERRLLLPPAAPDNDRVIAYLTGRGIDRDILDYCISTGRLYESADFHSCVFVGMDMAGTPRYATLRGTKTSFKGEAGGSDKRYSFSIPAEKTVDMQELHIFESPIDALSYITLLKLQGEEDWREKHFLSLGGLPVPKRNASKNLPVALTRFLEDYPETWHLNVHLDNDAAGRAASYSIFDLMDTRYAYRNLRPTHGKDVNDELRHHLGPKTPRKEYVL